MPQSLYFSGGVTGPPDDIRTDHIDFCYLTMNDSYVDVLCYRIKAAGLCARQDPSLIDMQYMEKDGVLVAGEIDWDVDGQGAIYYSEEGEMEFKAHRRRLAISEAQRRGIECVRVIISKDEVFWSFRPKHLDYQLSTPYLTPELLRKIVR
jgi:hypothetical protein